MKRYLLMAIIIFRLFYFGLPDAAAQTNGMFPPLKAVFVNGDSLHYIDVGKGDPIVFVHGTLGDFRTWGGQIAFFSQNYRVIAYSRRYAWPNEQKINDSADYTATLHAKDLAELIKALKLGPVHLVGHSYGAFTALLMTINNPELVRSLTLGEPPAIPFLQNVPHGDSILNAFITNAFVPAAKYFKSGDDQQAVKAFVFGVIGDDQFFAHIPEEGKAVMLANTLELRGSVFAKNLFPPVTCNDIRKIKVPVLFIKGDNSPLLFTAITDEIDKCTLNKEKVVLANSSHGLELQNPQDFNKYVMKFISKH